MLSLSDSAKLLSTLDKEQTALYERSAQLTAEQAQLHQNFLLAMRKLSNEQETIAKLLEGIDKGIAIAYSERSVNIYI